MKRFTVPRLVALLVLLLHGSAYGAAPLLDGLVSARANPSVAHVEAAAGATCISHDEATCRLCRVGTTTICVVPPHFATVAITRAERPAGEARDYRAATARTALHSRAPPVA